MRENREGSTGTGKRRQEEEHKASQCWDGPSGVADLCSIWLGSESWSLESGTYISMLHFRDRLIRASRDALNAYVELRIVHLLSLPYYGLWANCLFCLGTHFKGINAQSRGPEDTSHVPAQQQHFHRRHQTRVNGDRIKHFDQAGKFHR